ncbi:hypothetical protein FC83_GL001673 [Agrilactobacillus composti DSM 18527 = JCM 14202]|uniref:DUF2179 domain-containing protein n=1 Tax=Agrilactobacillus composti DSM 18527 = JCM 14202 TaxID=1423734 RepID=X0PN96_9LACO|nr:YitT family protein [Agrilactobacillus composti]KRM30538.1 hypothetical protein FC83_GL001673 [Agrilactobacillus composti DSM 18527 = JCM 14202]GAF38396.1 membrane protein [Agrilactobacillus composti DSM 18527 = JCM 14202]
MHLNKQHQTILKNGLLIVLGAIFYALAINYFLIPHKIGEGGVTGIMNVLYYTLGISPALTNLVLNGLLLIVGFRYLGSKTIWYTVWAVLCISFFLRLPVLYHYHTNQTIIPALVGGVLMGISMGIIFRADGTVAGSTILAKILNRYFGLSNGTGTLIFDLAVAIPSVVVIGFENTILTVIELYTSAVVVNRFLDRFGAKKSVTIITEETSAVTEKISNTLKQGITVVQARGYYSKTERLMLYLVCSQKQLAQLVPLVSEVDPNALVIVEQVRSVKGHMLEKIL